MDVVVVTVTDVAIALMILPWAVLVPLAYRIRHRDVRHEMEADREPLHQEVCGGAFGKARRSSPFVRIALYDDFLVIAYSRRIVLRYDEIEHVHLDGTRWPRAVRLRHHRDDLPEEIAIWSMDCRVLEEKIAAQRAIATDPLRSGR
ncbi:MAG: hypothetical protein PVF51_06330 [Nitrospirota bacterium]